MFLDAKLGVRLLIKGFVSLAANTAPMWAEDLTDIHCSLLCVLLTE